ncbi:Sas10/Utp3/C1D [Trinorchestia longiramus]|nr:Sas10/Utp3/C1D [Trinorchestia longiramus]
MKSGQADIPPSLAPKMLSMMNALDELQSTFAPFVSKPHTELFGKLNALERAKAHVMEAYTVNALFWALIKMSSDSDAEQAEKDLKAEMGRIKEAQKRIADLEARANMQRIDRAAARRFIQHGLGSSDKRKSNAPVAKEEEEEDHNNPGSAPLNTKPKKRSKLQANIDSSWQ